jgi:glutamate N-acetyltransferase/amino-acid N-acetyltransferase
VSVVAPAGFTASGVACGIKPSGAPDLSLVATTDGRPVAAAAVFTQNKMTAAPVIVTARHLEQAAGRAAAVVLNSGCANAATGEPGIADAEAMCAAVAAELGTDASCVLVCSTGLIGYRLPMGPIGSGVHALVAARTADPSGGVAAAEAIRTTDTTRKESVVRGDGFTVGGMAKGAAMLAPNMATMLAVLTTDAGADPAWLRAALQDAVAGSFNALSVDGCTSTNDTVILLANGVAGSADPDQLRGAISEACLDLATQMAGDAEGHTKVVRVRVTGAVSGHEAQVGARKVAESQLVKCSWFGKDPYWGRVASELGSAGIAFDQARLRVAYGDIVVADGGTSTAHDAAKLAAYMDQPYLEVTADLGLGDGEGAIITNDLTHAYVDENMGTS